MDHVRAAIYAGDKIMEAGGAPFLPQLSVLHHLVAPNHYEQWMKVDFMWVARCDATLRLPGASSGADREVDYTAQLGKPIYFTLEECLLAIKGA